MLRLVVLHSLRVSTLQSSDFRSGRKRRQQLRVGLTLGLLLQTLLAELLVLPELATLAESRLAHVTLVRLEPCVDVFVLLEVLGQTERLSAKLARERLLYEMAFVVTL